LGDKQIKYYSTNLRSPEVTFREALLKGLAPDGGLYMPLSIPQLQREKIESFSASEYYEIAFDILNSFLYNEIDTRILHTLCHDTYNFIVPLENVINHSYILRLDQGPTASFKDFAARMMAKLIHYYTSIDNRQLTVLTATSGDTGSAVASAFQGLTNIEVIILYPSGEVTDTQRKQMTTLNGNIHVVAIDGKFDDCQNLVKHAFTDPSLSSIYLTSANSINIGRLLPQSVYYFYAWSRLPHEVKGRVTFSVPSGNYGNLMGGIIAREMGLPVGRFIISTNMNNEVPEYLATGRYETISPSINCISSAMNVGHPGNLARVFALYGGVMNEKGLIIKGPDLEKMRKDFFGTSVSDEKTRETIAECYKNFGILLEPHGAVAWKGLELYREQFRSEYPDDLFVTLETAHPAKFQDEIRRILGFSPLLPEALIEIESKKEDFIEMENNYEKLRDYIRNH
jgi:threonine synthase